MNVVTSPDGFPDNLTLYLVHHKKKKMKKLS
jgi:hypothetical protein